VGVDDAATLAPPICAFVAVEKWIGIVFARLVDVAEVEVAVATVSEVEALSIRAQLHGLAFVFVADDDDDASVTGSAIPLSADDVAGAGWPRHLGIATHVVVTVIIVIIVIVVIVVIFD
jgi:hypothetical protein